MMPTDPAIDATLDGPEFDGPEFDGPGLDGPGLDRLEGELIEQWDRLLPHQTELGRDLLRRYREKHRHYHDVRHLAAVLRRIDEFADDHDLFLVRLAAWFHDAVYAIPPGQLSNED